MKKIKSEGLWNDESRQKSNSCGLGQKGIESNTAF